MLTVDQAMTIARRADFLSIADLEEAILDLSASETAWAAKSAAALTESPYDESSKMRALAAGAGRAASVVALRNAQAALVIANGGHICIEAGCTTPVTRDGMRCDPCESFARLG